MQEPIVIYRFQKNPEEEVRFCFKEYKDRQYLDLRLWFQPPSSREFFPTKKGITLGLDYLPELKKGVEKAVKYVSELPLQETSNSVK
jgi:hypothetical protein